MTPGSRRDHRGIAVVGCGGIACRFHLRILRAWEIAERFVENTRELLVGAGAAA